MSPPYIILWECKTQQRAYYADNGIVEEENLPLACLASVLTVGQIFLSKEGI